MGVTHYAPASSIAVCLKMATGGNLELPHGKAQAVVICHVFWTKMYESCIVQKMTSRSIISDPVLARPAQDLRIT